MNSNHSITSLEEKQSETKTTKNVQISPIIQTINLSPELKDFNFMNNFSRKERNDTFHTTFVDQEFKEYLETRRSKITPKQYRSQILSTVENRTKLLNEICGNTSQENSIHLFDNRSPYFFTSHYHEKPYYKSFLYPI